MENQDETVQRGQLLLAGFVCATLTRFNKKDSQRFVTPLYDSHGILKSDISANYYKNSLVVTMKIWLL